MANRNTVYPFNALALAYSAERLLLLLSHASTLADIPSQSFHTYSPSFSSPISTAQLLSYVNGYPKDY